MWVLAIVACGAGGVSSEGVLAGRVLDAAGGPVEGLLVQSLEGQSRTDEKGHFSLSVKPPNQYAHFVQHGIFYKRTLTDADHGQVVDLRIPTTRDASVSCPPQPCDLQLTWALGPSFEATLRHACTPGVSLKAAPPVDTPQVRCTAGKGRSARPLEVQVVDRGETLSIAAMGTPVRVEVRAQGGELPDDCNVRIGERVGVPAGDGMWSAEAPGPITVVAMCAGRAALPVRVDPNDLGDGVVVEWAAAGPTLDLESVAPWAAEVVLVAEKEGWNLSLRPDVAGTFQLPPLPQGRYRVLVRSETGELPLIAEPPPPVDSTLRLGAVGEDAMVGLLSLRADLQSGAVSVAAAE